ncbi:MAG TPA: type III pantothenate kinase [Thermoleophilia bacterium]|nr:type III pantothenate kinase [Thermoleophilia bacterium]
MLLAVDAGNTQTVLGLFEDSALGEEWRIATDVNRTGDELGALVDTLLRARGLCRDTVTALALSSVVPALNREYVRMARRYFGVEPLVVGPGVKTGMPIMTSNPRELGADLIVDAVAAFETVGGPCVVVDFGTATTFGAVSAKGEYLGHAIAPGIQTAMDALAARAAKLPRVELVDPGTVIGKTTVHSMQAGAVFGFAGQVDGLVTRMRAELGAPRAVSVATGGLASLIFDHAATLDRLDEHLTLRGLEIIHRRNQ